MIALVFALVMASPSDQGSNDARISVVNYDPAQVVDVAVSPGFATVIEFDRGEAVESVVVGDSENWQISSSGRGDQLVVKPLSAAGPTNLVVTTGTRRYAFALTTQAAVSPAYIVHFVYADAPLARSLVSKGQFKFSGSSDLYPAEMWQSGETTIIRWSAQTPIPAIFAVKDDGSEVLTNGRMVNDRYVVQGTAKEFSFRLGKLRSSAVRNSTRPTR